MHDFGKLVYLDQQKSGSAFTSAFLDECCTLELVKHEQHRAITDGYDPAAFYFISIRNPLKVYSSLFRYGKQKSGGMFARLENSGAVDIDAVYASVDAFIKFLLDPENASLLDSAFTPEMSEKYGFASYRFLRLSLQHPIKKIENHLRSGGSVQELKKQFIHSLVVKTESLSEDLYALSMNIKPEFFDSKKVESFLSSHESINASKVSPSEVPEFDPSVKSEIEQKDAILLEYYS